jgi:hypothetical protein
VGSHIKETANLYHDGPSREVICLQRCEHEGCTNEARTEVILPYPYTQSEEVVLYFCDAHKGNVPAAALGEHT